MFGQGNEEPAIGIKRGMNDVLYDLTHWHGALSW